MRTQTQNAGSTARARYRKLERASSFTLEQLEQRTFLSTSIPLNPFSWTALGPAPIVNGFSGPLTGPLSGRIAAVAAHPTDPNTIYIAAAGGGVWKTTNGGTSWAPLTDDQRTLFMGAIALAPSNPNIIYAGTGEGNGSSDSYYGRGVLKSTDAGATWTLLGNAAFDGLKISKIVVDPNDANVVYATSRAGGGTSPIVTGRRGVWKSVDGGLNWTNTTTSITDTTAYTDLAIDPSNPQVLYTAIGKNIGDPFNGVYKTSDGGANWAIAGNFPIGDLELGRITVAIAPSSPNTIYTSIQSVSTNGLYKMLKSTDAGATWTQLTNTPNYMGTQGWYDTTLIVDPANADIVYAGGQAGTNSIIRSADGGATWSNLHVGIDGHGPHQDHHGIAFDANGKLLDGNDGGIWRLDNPLPGSVLWSNLNGTSPGALNTIQFTGIALHPTNPDIAWGGSQDNGTERFVDSLGWNAWRGGDGGFVRVDQVNPTTVYHSFQQRGPNGTAGTGFLERSDTNGGSWTPITNGITATDPSAFYMPYVLDPSNSNRLLLGTNRVYESTNRGDLWTPISTPNSGGWTSNVIISALATAATDANTIYAAVPGSPALIFVTTDHGATWINRPVPGLASVWRDLQVDPMDSQIAYVVSSVFSDASGGGKVYRTTNGGLTWSNISGNLPDLPTFSIEIDPNGPGAADDVLYVGNDDGVYVSVNLGASWSRFGAGFPHAQVVDLEYNATLGILAAGTHGRGLWEIAIPAIGHWNGLGDGTSWNDHANWSHNTVPGAADDVVIDKPGSYTVLISDSGPTRMHSLSIGAAGASPVLKLAAGSAKTLVIGGGLSVAGSAILDLNDGDMILDYSSRSAALDAVQELINSGRNGGAWNGIGITSSAASEATAHNTTLGAMDSSDYWSVYGNGTTFDGETIDATTVLVKYTYYGDTDFNGRVNFDDYVRTDAGFNNHKSGWFNGDFDLNGQVNFDDYVLIDLAFNTQSGTLRR
jgi:photosystem II stability/assembly factor-like uncharacterized protein